MESESAPPASKQDFVGILREVREDLEGVREAIEFGVRPGAAAGAAGMAAAAGRRAAP